ncbi:hypothetical protein EMCRGX_G006949 [Ephydatia muelleri]
MYFPQLTLSSVQSRYRAGISAISIQSWHQCYLDTELASVLSRYRAGISAISIQSWHQCYLDTELASVLSRYRAGISAISIQSWHQCYLDTELASVLSRYRAGISAISIQSWHQCYLDTELASVLSHTAGISAISIRLASVLSRSAGISASRTGWHHAISRWLVLLIRLASALAGWLVSRSCFSIRAGIVLLSSWLVLLDQAGSVLLWLAQCSRRWHQSSLRLASSLVRLASAISYELASVLSRRLASCFSSGWHRASRYELASVFLQSWHQCYLDTELASVLSQYRAGISAISIQSCLGCGRKSQQSAHVTRLLSFFHRQQDLDQLPSQLHSEGFPLRYKHPCIHHMYFGDDGVQFRLIRLQAERYTVGIYVLRRASPFLSL